MIDRRSFLTAAGSALALSSTVGLPAQAAAGLQLGAPEPFSFDGLVARARDLAARPHQPAPPLSSEVLERIDYDAHGKIRFKTELAPFRDGPGAFPLTFFHLGRYFQTPVHMHLLEGPADRQQAREILYDPSYFDMPADSPARLLPAGAGFAGFRFQESRLGDPQSLPWQRNDWVAFLGASYFRAIGELYQYGLSARAVALDVALHDRPEEFPSFTRFWFEPPADGGTRVTVHALLEGPSLAGAYRFVMDRGAAVVMEVSSRLFLRRDIARLGLAPLTSMYWYSETAKPSQIDWRPEVHDSDGLAIWMHNGEHLWRPLNNPSRTSASAFEASHLRGFGLLQRDRVFDHYLDGVAYDRRPGLWVEPLGDWGEGAVQLIEIPTDDEIHDNTVALWVPRAPARAGNRYALDYRLHWSADEPHPTPLARVTATRLGRGGQPGQPRPAGVRKFVVDFQGGPLAQLPFGVRPEPVLSSSSGRFSLAFTEAVPDGVPGHWRASFDFTPEGEAAADLRLFLRVGEQALSETWLYLLLPVS
ncbi:glucan biosynthesis protein [Sphaerotilus hippei]|nr:glucan biosynthesis protein D [Sphaerotilus hippei]